MGNRDRRKAKKDSNLIHPACWNQMLTKAKKPESDKSARFIILKAKGMLKPNACNCYTWLLTKVKKQELAHFTILGTKVC